MKRFYVAAAIAASLLATGCQKTYVIDEVRTPIGFSTEVGKQTKAIVKNDGEYPKTQPFGVFAYGKQVVNETTTSTTVMDKVKIIYDDGDLKWRAEGTTKYYWPNDPTTTLSFYAYSPYSKAEGAEGMKITPSYVEPAGENAGGIKIEGYVHEDQTLDFMTADAKDRTFTQPDGPEGASTATPGTVKLQFKHQLTQLVFSVKKAADYTGIEMTLQSITLNNIGNTATFENGKWGTPSANGTYNITYNGASSMVLSKDTAVSSDGMTVIPQSLTASAESAPGQTMTIEYTISGTGVAEETVTKTVDLKAGTVTSWDQNRKITYNITIAMNEILFSPSVENWSPVSSNDIQINQ